MTLSTTANVTMIVAPAATETLVIYRDADPTQETDYTEGDAFPAETHETAFWMAGNITAPTWAELLAQLPEPPA